MKSFKQFILEENEPSILYHVTLKRNIRKIESEGLIPNKRMGFTLNRMGGTLSKEGYVYAFENLTDALRWLAKASWDPDKGDFEADDFRIIKINDDKNQYEQDTHWESMGGKGRWLMKKGAISPEAITIMPPISKDSFKKLAGDNEITDIDIWEN